MSVIEFFVPGDPHGRDERSQPFKDGQGRARVRVYTTSAGRDWRETVWAHAMAQEDRPEEPYTGAVTMTLIFVRERPVGHYLGGDRSRDLSAEGRRRSRPITKPDLCNCDRPVEDALKRARYYRDDAQVVGRLSEKRWCSPGQEPGVHVTIRFDAD